MVRNISIKDTVYDKLEELKGKDKSFSEAIESLFHKAGIEYAPNNN